MTSTQQQVAAVAQSMGVPVSLALAVAQRESSFNLNAVSPAGAIGIMQVMPTTGKELGYNVYDPAQNIDAGVTYLKKMLDQFGGDESLALAAYNAGPGRATTPPPETRTYVSDVLGLQSQYAYLDSVDGAGTGTPSVFSDLFPSPEGDGTAYQAGVGSGMSNNATLLALAGAAAIALWALSR